MGYSYRLGRPLTITAFIVWRRPSKQPRHTLGREPRRDTGRKLTSPKICKTHGLPDVGQLLNDLNDARKSAAYGDVPAPELNAEVVASEIERYVDAVAELVEKGADDEA